MRDWTKNLLWIGGAAILAYWLCKRRSNPLDVSRNEDLAGGCAHLISLEEHLSSSYAQTGDPGYLDQLSDVRSMRQSAMSKLLPVDAPAENWCITKHFLAGSMRMHETGSKFLSDGDRASAAQCFQIASGMKEKALGFAAMRSDAPQCSVCQGG